MTDFASWTELEKMLAVVGIGYAILAWHVHKLQSRVDALRDEITRLQLRD